jgi:Protein of unknown function (DUF1629)
MRPRQAFDRKSKVTKKLKIDIPGSTCATMSDASRTRVTKKRGSGRSKPHKFYLVEKRAYSSASGRQLVNRAELFGDGHPRILTPPGPFSRGFRDYSARPRFRISKSLGRKLQDFEQNGEYWLVSDRARNILTSISDSDFKFLVLDTEVDPGHEPMVLWLCEVMPLLDAIDGSRPQVDVVRGDSRERVHQIGGLSRLVFDETIVGLHLNHQLQYHRA